MTDAHAMNAARRSTGAYLLTFVLCFQGLSGLAGGAGLVADPTGRALQIPLEWLQGSPFDSYLIPGLVLFSVLGVVPLAAAFGVWRRLDWGRPAAIAVAVALLVWIGVEVAVIGYQPEPPLQLVYGAVGLLLLLLALPRSTRNGT